MITHYEVCGSNTYAISSCGGSTLVSTSCTALEPCKPMVDCCTPAPAKTSLFANKCKENKRTKKMSRHYDEYNDCYVDTPTTDIQQTRDYFANRILRISVDMHTKLEKQFGLRDDGAPQNFEEFLARIQSGKYIFTDEKRKTDTPYWRDHIRWRDPAMKEDLAGFRAAWEVFSKESSKANDAVMALSADKAMEAVQALESWTTK